jgi:hypothetical protein
MKKIYNQIVEQVVNGVNGHYLTPMESKNIAQIEKKVNDIIQEILANTNASRVSIVKYHNGNKDMTGMSFLKMSMTNEVVNRGIEPIMNSFKDLFRSYLAYWCHEIEIKGRCIITDAEELQKEDMTMYEYLKMRNIKSAYGSAIRDINDNIVGFLCVEYLDKDDFDLEKITDTIENAKKKIQTLTIINRMESDKNEL